MDHREVLTSGDHGESINNRSETALLEREGKHEARTFGDIGPNHTGILGAGKWGQGVRYL